MRSAGPRSLAALFAMVLALVASPAASYAQGGIVEKVAGDLKPQTGVVVMPIGEEFLIDLDASRGIAEGDLFAVVRPGKQVVHPTTGEILGNLEEIKAILQVTRVKPGFSHARPVGGAQGVGQGDSIRRYENLPATLWDYTGRGEALYAELKAALPGLVWQGYAAAQALKPRSPEAPVEGGPPLVFVLRQGALEVRGPAFELLRSYPLPGAPALPAAAPSVNLTPPGPVASGIVPPEVVAAEPPAAIVRKAVETHAGIWYSPDMKGGVLGMEAGDFDGDGKREMAVAFAERLEISRLVGTEYASLATVDAGAGVKILSVDGADLDGDGKVELYLTASRNGRLSSQVVSFAEGRYVPVESDIPWYFRAVDLPGEGRVLLAQRMGDLERDFDGPIFRVTRTGGRLGEGSPLELPWAVSLYGFLPFTGERGETLYANLSINDYLQVLSADGEQLWESSDYFGGSESYFERTDPAVGGKRSVFIKARLERGRGGEILVTANKGSRLLASFRKFKQGRVVALQWDGHSLQELWHTRPLEGYLADYRLADVDNDGQGEVALTVGFSKGGFWGKDEGRSALAVIEIP